MKHKLSKLVLFTKQRIGMKKENHGAKEYSQYSVIIYVKIQIIEPDEDLVLIDLVSLVSLFYCLSKPRD